MAGVHFCFACFFIFDFAYIVIENANKDNEKRNYNIETVVIKIYAEVPEINLDFTVKYCTLYK